MMIKMDNGDGDGDTTSDRIHWLQIGVKVTAF